MSHRPESLPVDDRYNGRRGGTAAQRAALSIQTIAESITVEWPWGTLVDQRGATHPATFVNPIG